MEVMARTGLAYHPIFLQHDTGPGHPERPDRLRAITERIEQSGLGAQVERHEPGRAALDPIRAIHDSRVIEMVRAGAAGGSAVLDGGDTVVSEESYEAALVAVAAALESVDRVLDGTWDNAFAACRPPGHHAEANQSMGFCLFNNVAVAAEHARSRGTERVAIVDWDVHHGNGTQHIFERRPDVFYASLHQWPWYPGTGAAGERGLGDGEDATLNLPMHAGAGDGDYLRAFEDTLLPALETFDPGLVLVSAGFDAHALDPLSATRVSTAAFGRMTTLLQGLAGGRLVSLLEGGYDLTGLSESVEAHVAALLEAPAR
jgi:acetoin utilization deacetylase AcuC-like enzyme